jgi:hypothetical protein
MIFFTPHHLSDIKTLQTILLKVSLVLGAEIFSGVEFKDLIEPTEEGEGWRVVVSPDNPDISLSHES